MGVPQGKLSRWNTKYFGNLFVRQIKFVPTAILVDEVEVSAAAEKIIVAESCCGSHSTRPEPASPPELLLRS